MLDNPEKQTDEFLKDVLHGLSQPQKSIPCQWFYDEAGSELFQRITQLPEYYPTRTETQILKSNIQDITDQIGEHVTLVEYGAGASIKTQIILDDLKSLAAYIPIDVSADFLHLTAEKLRNKYPDLLVHPVVGNFLTANKLPDIQTTDSQRSRFVGFFPGSTIGNLSDQDIHSFLTRARADLGHDALFLLGFDLRKDLDILIPAYDDAAGVTAEFNLNMLKRINRELKSDFDLSAFMHEARWNDEASRIEMHLISTKEQTVKLADHQFSFHADETIHTENSRKFTMQDMAQKCAEAGWTMRHVWTDECELFAVTLMDVAN